MPRQPRMLRAMTNGFAPIRLEDYVERHLRSNPETKREDLIDRLHHAIAAFRRGEHCRCGQPIWIIGSAEVGLACFTCITGESEPDRDYEIDLTEFGDIPAEPPVQRTGASRVARTAIGRPWRLAPVADLVVMRAKNPVRA